MQTALTKALGIKYPIIQGGMQWVGTAELAAAVSNAGGLGIITALTQPSPQALRDEIAKCRTLTDKPFGCNLTFLPAITPPPYEEYMQAIVESGVKIIETAGNTPKAFMPYLNQHHVYVIHKCTSLRHCLSAERAGVSAVSVDGFDCAGHPGEDDIPLFVLLPRVLGEVKVPVIASGGIADGRGLAAALAMGACGVNMGTRFLCTVEAPVHQRVKEALVAGDERNTTHIFRSLRNTARVYKNAVAVEVREIEAEPGKTEFSSIAHLVSGKRGRTVFQTGDIDAGIWTAGPSMGLIHDIPTCHDLLASMADDATGLLSPPHARL